MRKTPKSAKAIAADAHLYDDVDVTLVHPHAYAKERPEVQLEIMARLRVQTASQDGSQQLTLQGVGISVLAVLIALSPGLVPHAPAVVNPTAFWWAQLVSNLFVFSAIAGIVVIVLIPLIWDVTKSTKKRDRSVVWLAAYSDELARHRGRRGAAGRAWRRSHPV